MSKRKLEAELIDSHHQPKKKRKLNISEAEYLWETMDNDIKTLIYDYTAIDVLSFIPTERVTSSFTDNLIQYNKGEAEYIMMPKEENDIHVLGKICAAFDESYCCIDVRQFTNSNYYHHTINEQEFAFMALEQFIEGILDDPRFKSVEINMRMCPMLQTIDFKRIKQYQFDHLSIVYFRHSLCILPSWFLQRDTVKTYPARILIKDTSNAENCVAEFHRNCIIFRDVSNDQTKIYFDFPIRVVFGKPYISPSKLSFRLQIGAHLVTGNKFEFSKELEFEEDNWIYSERHFMHNIAQSHDAIDRMSSICIFPSIIQRQFPLKMEKYKFDTVSLDDMNVLRNIHSTQCFEMF
eukprot:979240_1